MKIKQLIENDNTAIKIRYYSSDSEPVTISMLMKSIRVDFRKIPTEMTIPIEKTELWELPDYNELRNSVKNLEKSHPAVAEKLSEQLFSLRYAELAEEQSTEFKEEAAELLEHITIYLQSRLVQLAEDVQEAIKKDQKNGIIKIKAELKKYEK